MAVRRKCGVSFVFVATVLVAAPASGDEPSAEAIAAARDLTIKGMGLARKGKCADAIEPLERAKQLYPAPTITAELGECQVSVGRLVAGSENLRLAANADL